jgi:agmatinase
MTQKKELFASPRNFLGIEPSFSNELNSRVVILPIPYDGTEEWHSGSRFGPREIIDASEYLEYYDLELDRETYRCGIFTAPFLQPDAGGPKKTVDSIFKTSRPWVKKSKFVLSIGGEHTVSLGTVQAYREQYDDLNVIQLDAHADLRDYYNGSKYGQATVMRRISEIAPVFEIGVRSISSEEKRFIDKNNIPVLYNDHYLAKPALLDQILDRITGHVYLTVDMDVFDPSLVPAVGTPEPGGLGWQAILDIIKSIAAKLPVVGADIVELSPAQGSSASAYTAAKLAYKIIGYCVK